MIYDINKSSERIRVGKYGEVVILFEDNQILTAYKPAGVLSQSDGSGAPDMLTVIKGYLKEKYNKPGQVFLGLVHRLDRPVSGVMVFAKTSKAASRLSEQIRKHELDKRYRLIADGRVGNIGDSDELVSYLIKDRKNNISKTGSADSDETKECRLIYSVDSVKEYNGRFLSLVNVRLLTGRSHQIRVQFAEIKHPLIGDVKYNNTVSAGFAKDICLESYLLGFNHPVSKERMIFELAKKNSKPWILFTDKETK